MTERRRLCAAVAAILVLTAGAAPSRAGDTPIPVSPASDGSTVSPTDACPTFSWSMVDDATGYELAVFALEEGGLAGPMVVAPSPVLSRRLPAGSSSWTPSRELCFGAKQSYAWVVRAVHDEGDGEWSPAAVFAVPAAPSIEEVTQALAVLRRYSERKSVVLRAGETQAPIHEVGSRSGIDLESTSVDEITRATARRWVGAIPTGGRNSGVASSAPVGTRDLLESAMSVDGHINLGSGSMLLRAGSPFLWQDGVFNVALGVSALGTHISGEGNLGIGSSALFINEGSRNSAFGNGALQVNVGNENTAAGYAALAETIGANENTAVGVRSLFQNSASYNTAIGWESLYENDTGAYNNALGWRALHDNEGGERNTALGAAAMSKNTSGAENTAIGVDAAFWNTSGSLNTAVGRLALHYNTQGSGNIALGYQAGVNLGNGNTVPDTDLDDNIFIGSPGEADDSGTIRIGGANHTATYIAGIKDQAVFWTEGVTVLVDNTGKLGTIPSSRRYKEDVEALGEASTPLLSLRPVSFRYRRSQGDGSKPIQFGLIAEEVAEVLPELVVFDEQGRPETVKYHLLSTLLLNELQKQIARNDRQERLLARQEAALAELRRELRSRHAGG